MAQTEGVARNKPHACRGRLKLLRASPAGATVIGTEMYFMGCDMGGWHTTTGDALAVCKWDGYALSHVQAMDGALFYPVSAQGALAQVIRLAEKESARIIIGIDAALAWPAKFVALAGGAPQAAHLPDFVLGTSIDNPYLYRDTERFVKQHILTGANERPLTAAGDKFGNNSSKAQALVAWFRNRLPDLYRPPFDPWDAAVAAQKQFTLIEVYPAASMKAAVFRLLAWPHHEQTMDHVGNTDIGDAKRCAMTAVCYAAMLGMLGSGGGYPPLYTPDDAGTEYNQDDIGVEGWIFAPKRS